MRSNLFRDDFPNKEVNGLSFIYNETLAHLINKTIKVKSISPSYNETLRQTKVEKRSLEYKWLFYKTAEHYRNYRDKCNEYTHLCNQTKTEYYSEAVNNCDGINPNFKNYLTN